jgi:hypothetical protein
VPSQKVYKKRLSPSPTKKNGKRNYAYLPLSGEVTIASGDTDNETIIVSEVVGSKDRIVGLGGRIHLGQDLLGESLGNPRVINKSSQTRNVKSPYPCHARGSTY